MESGSTTCIRCAQPFESTAGLARGVPTHAAFISTLSEMPGVILEGGDNSGGAGDSHSIRTCLDLCNHLRASVPASSLPHSVLQPSSCTRAFAQALPANLGRFSRRYLLFGCLPKHALSSLVTPSTCPKPWMVPGTKINKQMVASSSRFYTVGDGAKSNLGLSDTNPLHEGEKGCKLQEPQQEGREGREPRGMAGW